MEDLTFEEAKEMLESEGAFVIDLDALLASEDWPERWTR